MRLRNIILLYRVRLRARLSHELFAILGIAVGVALLFASQIVRASPDNAIKQLVNGVVGEMRFQLAARGSGGFDQSLLDDVRRLPGVQAAIPVFEERANLIGPRGQQPVELLSTDARYAHLGGPLLRRFSAAQLNHQRALALPVELGDSVGLASLEVGELEVGGHAARVFIGAVLFEGGLGALTHSRIVFAPLAYAQQLAGMPGRLTSILVRPRKGRERAVRTGLERLAAGRLNVQPADFTTALFNQAAAPSNQSAQLFAVIGALVGFLFALNALMFTASQRRNLVEDLRLDGYSRRMIVEVLLFDALVLGVFASLLGLALGDLLSAALFSSNPGYLSFAFPINAQRIVSWQSIVFATCGGMLAAFAGVLVSLRRAILARRLAAGPAHVRRRLGLRLALGELVCWTVTAVTLLLVPGAAIVGIVSLVVALLLALPWLLGVCLRVADRLQRSLSSTAAHLAVIELRSTANWSRTLAIAATGATAVFGSVAVEGAQSDLQRGLDHTAHDLAAGADVWVTAAGAQNVLATTGFIPAQTGQLAHLPCVRSVGLYRGGFLDDGSRRVWVMAPPASAAHPIPPSQLLDGDLALATSRLRHGGWAVVSQGLANEHHVRVGQSFMVPAPLPIVLRVAALSTNIGWPPGAIVMNASDYARAWPGAEISAYAISLRAGFSPLRGRREIQRALGASGAGLAVETRLQREQRLRATSRQGLSRLTQITRLVLIAAILAMATAMGALIWQRRPLLADMKVDGFDKRVLWRSLLVESTLLLGVGCSIGALFGLGGQLLLSHALAVVTGFPAENSISALIAIGSLLAVTSAAVAIVAVPGYLATRVRAAVVLQD
jgi:putative ABC transport system permease protein